MGVRWPCHDQSRPSRVSSAYVAPRNGAGSRAKNTAAPHHPGRPPPAPTRPLAPDPLAQKHRKEPPHPAGSGAERGASPTRSPTRGNLVQAPPLPAAKGRICTSRSPDPPKPRQPPRPPSSLPARTQREGGGERRGGKRRASGTRRPRTLKVKGPAGGAHGCLGDRAAGVSRRGAFWAVWVCPDAVTSFPASSRVEPRRRVLSRPLGLVEI